MRLGQPHRLVGVFLCTDQPVKNYGFIDYVTQFYLCVVALLIILFHGQRVPWWQLYVGGHIACMVVVHLLINAHAARPENRLLDLLRHFYPVLLYIPFYRETGALNHMFVEGLQDGFFIGLDQRLFGFQPSIAFMDWLPYLPVSELFYLCYFSYYVMIFGVGLALYFQDKSRFFNYVSVVSFIFYICYLIYIFLPVVGARVFWSDVPGFPQEGLIPFPPAVQAGLFFRIMRFIYAHFEAHGAAFPSSHIAVAICTVWFSWRYIPKIRYIHLVDVILLILSTVYCRYHYVVDVFAGLVTAAALIPLSEFLYAKFNRASCRAAAMRGTPTSGPPA